MTPAAPILVATLIVRDEERCIGRCLESIVGWVDGIVVLDTGSRDDTVAIARRLGAEVHHLDWPESFAAARNHVLALADADWNLMLDADEWLIDGGASLRQWCAGAPRLGRVCIHSEAEGAATASRSWITRLLPRGSRYEGRVHEQVVSPLPRAATALQLGHDGYRNEQIARKRGRNHPLLLRDLADAPGDPYILYQLGKDADMRGDAEDACGRYADALERTPESANWRHELVICAMQAMARAGRLGDGMALADAEIDRWPHSPDFFFTLGELLMDHAVADPAAAIDHWLPLVSSAWERCLEIGERPELEGSVAGRGSHLAQHNLNVVRSQLALFAA